MLITADLFFESKHRQNVIALTMNMLPTLSNHCRGHRFFAGKISKFRTSCSGNISQMATLRKEEDLHTTMQLLGMGHFNILSAVTTKGGCISSLWSFVLINTDLVQLYISSFTFYCALSLPITSSISTEPKGKNLI